MKLAISTGPATVVKLTRIERCTRYDVEGYRSGGLPYGYKSDKGDAYLVSKEDGTVLGAVEKWNDGKWTASKLHSHIKLDSDDHGANWAFSPLLYDGGKTRKGAVEKLVAIASHPNDHLYY